MMMKLGPVIWMFSKTRAPDCAISVLIAERTAGLTWAWMSLATVNPFPSAITEPRIPVVLRRNSPKIFPSCPSMPSSEKLERAAFRRDSLRCIPFPPGPVQDRGLLEQHRAAGSRLLHETEERAFRRSSPDVIVHAREREKCESQEARDGPEECEEADDNPEVCHGRSNARLRIACFKAIYLSLRMFSFVTNLRAADCARLRLSWTR